MVTKSRRTLVPILLLLLCGCNEPQEQAASPLERLQRLLALRGTGAKTYYAHTEDNWHVALHRLQPPPERSPVPPVVLCHGLGHNSRFWELNETNDLAAYLREAGCDVWLLDLRGSGFSTKPAWQLIHGPEIVPQKWLMREIDKLGWTIDDHVLYDLPAAIKTVKEHTGAPSVVWVGHSLGAMIALGYLERVGDGNLHGIAAFSPAMIVPQPPNNIMRDIKYFRFPMATINNRLRALAGVITRGQIKSPIDTLFYNAENVEPGTLNSLFLNASEDISPRTTDQLLQLAGTGVLQSADRSFNYSEELHRVEAPVLFIAGKLDNMAEPEAVRAAFHAVSSCDKQFRLFGLANGDSIDYGHNDLVIGKRSAEEVFPVIKEWILAHPSNDLGNKRVHGVPSG